MKVFQTDHIRNIGLGGHGSSGKTMLFEALLFNLKEINRIGSIEQGSTVSDYNPDEIERQISISSSLGHGVWKDHKINIIDTPGYSDFFGEVVSAMRVVDTMFVVVSAASGVEVGTEMVWAEAAKQGVPRFIVINKLDRENIDFDNIVQGVVESFGHQVVLAQFPVETGPNFDSIIDLFRMKMLKFAKDGSGNFSEEEIPAELKEKAEELYLKLVEAVAESDDTLMEKYFEAGELSEEEFKTGFKKAVANDAIFPIFCTAATANVGVKRLLDIIVNFCPAPNERGEVKTEDGTIKVDPNGPTAALVFKTISEQHMGELSFFKVFSGKLKTGEDVINTRDGHTERIGQMFILNGKNKKSVEELQAGDIGAVVKLKNTHTSDTLCAKGHNIKFPKIDFPEPVIRTAIKPKAKGDEEKISNGLHLLHEEDPTFLYHQDPELHQTIVSGQGELHLQIILKRLHQKFNVEVEEEEPKIPYRETIRKTATAQGKFKKQTGGRGQYGDCHLRLEPMERGGKFEFLDEIVGGVIPGKFIPAVEKGVIETMEKGVLAGYPVVDVRVAVYDGSYHTVDSSEMAFKVAASMAFKKAFLDANPVLLEPIYNIEVRVPDEYMGDVMGDISSRRGRIMGMDRDGRFQVIKAQVPLAELYRYSTTLRSLTQGRGIHKRSFSHYEEVPPDIAQKIIEASKKEQEES
ncbi:translation elongation factor G [Caldithrix abyssi DSM 13497]|uniref:Elongation factor G n=1 Tax=Caldithrix abyssi DSM 13497 TaxID=880073 RepID=H1XR83_CALAY|nr:elongation factor G [Caldithrix abyssi]APF17086.1 translation elongation factor 2 (EF-2/EF-G) [Caldithrix abyssi DSM 13497]EHO41234.1 translation elongation factor G [Caldithrix abyssi DSM 13497]